MRTTSLTQIKKTEWEKWHRVKKEFSLTSSREAFWAGTISREIYIRFVDYWKHDRERMYERWDREARKSNIKGA